MQKSNLVLLLFLGVLLSRPVKAQRFKFGLSGGVNITDVDGMDPVDDDNDFHKFGFTGGIFVDTHLGSQTITQMEITYSQKGSSMPPDTNLNNQGTFNNNGYYKFRLNYVDVNLVFRRMIHLNVSKKPTDKFGIEAGISLGYMFHYYYSVQSITYSLDSLHTIDISPFIGLSYNFTPGFCIDVRYYNSINSVFSHPPNNQFLYHNSWNLGHNLCFQITFQYTFGAKAPAPSANNSTPANTNFGS